MKCQECGNLGFTASSCPDCGSDNVVEEVGGAAQPQTPTTAPEPEPPVMPDMPAADMTVGVTPVIGVVKLPDGSAVELREGEELLVAREDTDAAVHVKLPDETVSATPIRVFAEGGVGKVTGGGGNGFALDITLRFAPSEMVEVPKTAEAVAALIARGKFVAVALKVGKVTRFPLKF